MTYINPIITIRLRLSPTPGDVTYSFRDAPQLFTELYQRYHAALKSRISHLLRKQYKIYGEDLNILFQKSKNK